MPINATQGAAMPLTDTACRNARCPEGRAYQRFSDAGGLYLEVTKTAKCWRWKYRMDGKERRLALGLYPAVSLSAARKSRDDARLQLVAGTDPNEAKQEAKRDNLAKREKSFEAVARQWWAQWHVGKSQRHADHVIKRLEADAFPTLGAKSVDQLTAPHFVRMTAAIETRGAGDIARRVLQTSGQVMRYAIHQGLIHRNPVADVKPGDFLKSRQQVHFPSVSTDELPELMRKIMAYQGNTYTRLALQLLALTFVRPSELREASWSEFDLERAQWTIPKERTKSRNKEGRVDLVVPLATQAIELLRYLQTARGDPARCVGAMFVFPGERDHDKPMSDGAVLGALRRMGYAGRQTGHGFRSIASTALNEMGYRPDVIEAQLSHSQEDKVRAAYNHARYLEERIEMMQAWADYIDAVKQTGKVVPFRHGRKLTAG